MIDLLPIIVALGLFIIIWTLNWVANLPDPFSCHLNYEKKFLEREKKEVKKIK
jgi:hypothetical protein